jgi:hypothetical protein
MKVKKKYINTVSIWLNFQTYIIFSINLVSLVTQWQDIYISGRSFSNIRTSIFEVYYLNLYILYATIDFRVFIYNCVEIADEVWFDIRILITPLVSFRIVPIEISQFVAFSFSHNDLSPLIVFILPTFSITMYFSNEL